MMKTWMIRLIAIGLILVSGFLIFQGVRALQGTDSPRGDTIVATVEASAGQIVFHPVVDYEIAGFTLVVVSQNGFRWEGEFGPDNIPAFKTVDAAGNSLPDGSYRYALQAYPLV
ncbi:MAG TPA: hypothetical protein VI451_15860, partial [Anaerolineales bacterium]|nr:hypothetical protein [Anaerolineales bacterium]